MKKLISIVLAVSMLISLVPTFAFATEAENTTSNIITLFDFGDTAALSDVNYNKKAATPSALAYEGKESSLKWEMDITSSADGYVSNSYDLNLRYTQDLSKFDDATINVRFYSENSGSKFNLIYSGVYGENLSEDIGWKDGILVSHNNAVEIENGWQVYSVSLKEVMKNFRAYDENKTLQIKFNDDGFSNYDKTTGEYYFNDGDTVYIDEIWVDTNPDAYYDNIAANTDNKLIWTSEDGITSYKSTEATIANMCSLDADRNSYINIVSKTTQLTYLGDNYVDSDGIKAYTSLFNCSANTEYPYLNLWMYSEQPQDAGIVVSLVTATKEDKYVDGSYVAANDAENAVRYAIPQLNWKGWKLVTINLTSDYDSGTNANRGKVLSVRLDVDKWRGQALANLPVSGTSIAFGIDGMWVSKTSAQAEWEESNSYGNKEALNTTAIFNKDFNAQKGLINKATTYHVTHSMNADYNRYNSNLYDMSARLSFASPTYDEIKALGTSITHFTTDTTLPKMASLQIKGRTARKISKADEYASNPAIYIDETVTNPYINAWIYNPEPKYTFDGKTFAEFLIVLGHRGATGDDNSAAYHGVAVAANWSGWKLISIPLSEWKGVSDTSTPYITNGIYHIYISCNMSNYPLDADGNVYIVERTEAQKQAGYALIGRVDHKNGTAHNVFSRQYNVTQTDGVISGVTETSAITNANLYNYIDVERVWISDGPVTDTEPDLLPADNSELKCSSDGKAVDIFTSNDAIAKTNINVIKTVGNTVSKVNASYSNGTVTLPEFTYGATYSVYADVCGANGVYNKDEFTFTTEDIHVGDKLISDDGKTATITFHGNLGEYENSLLVAAVYSGSNKQELEAAIPGTVAENGVATVTIPENIDTEGKTVEFFFFDSLDNIKPLKFNFQK